MGKCFGFQGCASFLPDGLAAFRAFLRTEFSEENLEFWLSCEDYKKIKSQSKMTSKAKKIFAEYIAIQSCKEVSVGMQGGGVGGEDEEKVVSCLMQSKLRFIRKGTFSVPLPPILCLGYMWNNASPRPYHKDSSPCTISPSPITRASAPTPQLLLETQEFQGQQKVCPVVLWATECGNTQGVI